MAITRPGLEALLMITRDRPLGDTVMIGRLALGPRARTINRIFGRHRRTIAPAAVERICSAGYAEELLKFLGAGRVESIDASAYEGATIVHDMSEPLPRNLRGCFDTLVDGGTVEHIFDFPQAVENYLNLLRPGGRMLCVTNANNFCGHGFYQYSPELWFGVLRANLCSNIRVFLVPARSDAPWFEVTEPAALRGRVEIVNAEPTYILILASKTAGTPDKLQKPQQSDYENVEWQGGAIEKPFRAPMPQLARMTRALVTALTKPFGRKSIPAFGLSDHPHVKAFDPADEASTQQA